VKIYRRLGVMWTVGGNTQEIWFDVESGWKYTGIIFGE
jgi:hypothetical protein